MCLSLGWYFWGFRITDITLLLSLRICQSCYVFNISTYYVHYVMTTYHIISVLNFLEFYQSYIHFVFNLHQTCELNNMEYEYRHD